MWQWWSSRSTSEVAMTSSPKMRPHSSKLWLEVRMVEPVS